MAATPTRSGTRMSADERRHAVIAAAITEFAHGGLDGTSTERIAARAGISQPYVFRLFPTKQALFLAAVGRCFERIRSAFDEASDGLEGLEAIDAMGDSYKRLITDEDLLLMQLHAYAASADPIIQAEVQASFLDLMAYVRARTGCGDEVLLPFFAVGLLCNVITALGLGGIDQLFCGATPRSFIVGSAASPS